MEETHRKVIQRNFASLVEMTDLDTMVTALYEKGVFSEQMIEPYRDTNESARERKRKMYLDITRRGPHAFDKLIEALMENGHWDLVRDLDPQSSLHPLRNTHSNTSHPKPKPKNPEEGFVSISTEKTKNRLKSGLEAQKNNSAVSSLPQNVSSVNNNDLPDLSTDIPHFKVNKSTKFIEEDETKDVKLYRTRGRQRGVLLVLSYISFVNNIEEYRAGVDVDCKKLKYLFEEFGGFKVISYYNLTIQETRNTLQNLREVLVRGVESVFVVVSSHGYERRYSSDNDIRCSDGNLISLYEIIEYFSNANLPAIVDVPKVFIFQLCRGTKSEYVLDESLPQLQLSMPSAVRDGTPATPQRSAARTDNKPYYSDILIAHSTLPGFVSYRSPAEGSWYIQTLCSVFAERAHDCHVDKMFKLVDDRMRRQFHKQTSSVDRWGFNKNLYLHPGLFE